jgi:signal transduction histidine kinase
MEGLVVAPGRDDARPLVNFLRSQRLNIQLVSDADTAFEEALIHPPDVILIHDAVPPAGGIELCQRLKGNTRTHFVPAILASDADERGFRLRAFAAGADAVFGPDADQQERRTRLWALLRTHTLYRRQERKRRSQGSAIQTRRAWVSRFVHDLQSSLSALQANLEYLAGVGLTVMASRTADGDTGPNTTTEVSECVKETRTVMSQLTRGLRTVLDYERLEGGRVVFSEAPVRMADVAAEAKAELQGAAEVARKRLDLEVAGTPATVRGDRELLKRAVQNLVGHCLRQPLNSRVTLQIREGTDGVRVVVRGDGDILSLEDRERIFEPYAPSVRHAPVGHGLGLALAKAVVEMHDGAIWVEDVGRPGWSFVFDLKPEPAVPMGKETE